MVFQHFGSHKSRGPHQPPCPLCGSKLADAIVGKLYKDSFHSKAGCGWKGILWIWELPHEDVVTLEVTIEDSTGVEVLDGSSNLERDSDIDIYNSLHHSFTGPESCWLYNAFQCQHYE